MGRPPPTVTWPTTPCPVCREPIIWALGPAGLYVKVDPEPHPRGELSITANADGHAATVYKPSPHLAFGRKLYRRHPETCLPPDPRRPPARIRPGATPRLGPHPFDPYPAADYPPEPWTGRLLCRRCQALGQPGDQRHPIDSSPPGLPDALREQAAARDAAVLGEKGNHDEPNHDTAGC